MDRRQFLVLTGSAAAAGAVASWLGCSQHVNRRDPSRGGPVVPAGSRPFLALLVPPEGDADSHLRGEIVGGTLNHGGDELLADLAGVDLVCVTRDRLPPEAEPVGEPLPWFVLLTRVDGKVTSRPFRPTTPLQAGGGALMGRGEFEALDAEARARIEAFAAELHGFLEREGAGAPAGERAGRAAEARKRYVESPPPGAHWAQSNGCGMHVEGVRRTGPMVACGMGMVPEVSRRFLHFYVKA